MIYLPNLLYLALELDCSPGSDPDSAAKTQGDVGQVMFICFLICKVEITSIGSLGHCEDYTSKLLNTVLGYCRCLIDDNYSYDIS